MNWFIKPCPCWHSCYLVAAWNQLFPVIPIARNFAYQKSNGKIYQDDNNLAYFEKLANSSFIPPREDPLCDFSYILLTYQHWRRCWRSRNRGFTEPHNYLLGKMLHIVGQGLETLRLGIYGVNITHKFACQTHF